MGFFFLVAPLDLTESGAAPYGFYETSLGYLD